MSDWLDELGKRESEATQANWYVVGPPWGDGGFVVAGDPDPHVGRYVCSTDDLLIMDDDEAEEHGASNKLADAEFIAALRNNASELISRARRADEAESRVEHLERENEDLLRDWRAQDTTLRDMSVENERLFRALEACRAEMEHQGMDTSTPVRELHRGGRVASPKSVEDE